MRRDDKLVGAVAQVRLKFDLQNAFATNFVLATPSQQLSRFARKHAPKNKFDPTANLLLRNGYGVLTIIGGGFCRSDSLAC